MENEMVERVANAILDAMGQAIILREEDLTIVDGNIEIADVARAAIAAMREPTEAVGHVGAPIMAWRALGGGQLDGHAHASEAWRAMIDAALGKVAAQHHG